MNLPQLELDKANHFLYGAIITATVSIPFGIGVGFLVGICAAVAKELIDAAVNWKHNKALDKGPHTIDPKDALATALGSAAVATPYLVKFF